MKSEGLIFHIKQYFAATGYADSSAVSNQNDTLKNKKKKQSIDVDHFSECVL